MPSTTPTASAPAVLEVRQLVKRYPEHVAVDGIDLAIGRGQLHGLLGPNGSGKTTTLSCALGLLPLTSGTTQVLGAPSARVHTTRGKVAVVFDSPVLLRRLTIHQNLAYVQRLQGRRPDVTEADRCLERVGMAGFGPRRAGRLSLGQSRRISIAAGLLGSPELLVLDEPLSGLDPVGVRDMLALFEELHQQGLTIIVSSHRLHEMETLLTHATILLRGKIAATGSLDELLGARGRVRVGSPGGDALQRLCSERGWPCEQEDATTWIVSPEEGITTAEVNRLLVQAGVEVDRLEPARSSLPAYFDALVKRQYEQPAGKTEGSPS